MDQEGGKQLQTYTKEAKGKVWSDSLSFSYREGGLSRSMRPLGVSNTLERIDDQRLLENLKS